MKDETEQIGLRRRLEIEGRRIASQHARLREIWGVVTAAVESRDTARIREAVGVLDEGLRAHFELEERVQLPALHGADAETTAGLNAIVVDHVRFLKALDRVWTAIDADDLPEADRQLSDLASRLSAHEAKEEALFPKR